MYAIGKRIKAIREQKGISQKEFAASIGTKNTTVSNWEKGISRPDVDTLASICEVLEVSPDELLDIHISEDRYTLEEKRIIAQYRNKPELRQSVRILLGLEQITNN